MTQFPGSAVSLKKFRTPSPVGDEFEGGLKRIQFAKNRMKHASLSPDSFFPDVIFQKFPEMTDEYKLVTSFRLFEAENLSAKEVEEAVASMKDLLIHAVIRTQENNWMLVTQVEGYYHDRDIDDVSQNDPYIKYPNKSQVSFEKCEMGKSTWYEIRFGFKKLEFIATGGITNHGHDDLKLDAFLGVAVPSHIIQDINLLWFAPKEFRGSRCVRTNVTQLQEECQPKAMVLQIGFFRRKGI